MREKTSVLEVGRFELLNGRPMGDHGSRDKGFSRHQQRRG